MDFLKIAVGAVLVVASCYADYHDDLLRQFSQAKKAVLFGGHVRDIDSQDACKIDNWNNIQKYVCRCCIVREVDKISGDDRDAGAVLKSCKEQESICNDQLIQQLKQDESLGNVSDDEFINTIYDRSRVIKDVSNVVSPELAQTGLFTPESLKDFLVRLYRNKKLLEPAFSRSDCLTVKSLAGEGGGQTGQLFLVTSLCSGQQKDFIIKEMYGEKREIFDLTLVGHYAPLAPYIAPAQVKGFPIIDLPIAYVYFNGGNRGRYLSIMPKAHGEEFFKIMNAYITNPTDQLKQKLQKAYTALGTTLGNFHKKFMDRDSINGKTITHDDFHARNYFYDEPTDTIYWIDNERMGIATLDKHSPYGDLNYALFMPFDNDFLRLNSSVKNNPKAWFDTFYPSFLKAYINAFGGDIKIRAQQLKEVLSQTGSKNLLALINDTIDKLVSSEPITLQAGPLWNQKSAQTQCPTLCLGHQREWTGQWWTTDPGKMSVCLCK